MNRVPVVALCALLVLRTTSAAAQDAEAPPSALDLGREALALFQQGKWKQAHDRFQQADALSRTPVFRLYMARSLRELGQLVEARDLLRGIDQDALAEDAPTPWKQAKVDARAELAAIEQAIAAREPSAKPALTEPAKPAQLSSPAIVTLPPQARVQEGSLVPGGIVLGVGLASLLTGAITGGVALKLSSDIREDCGGEDQCFTQTQAEQSDIERRVASANAIGHASTGTLIAGGALAATGIVLLIVRPGGASAEAAKPATGARLAPTLGGFVMSGWF